MAAQVGQQLGRAPAQRRQGETARHQRTLRPQAANRPGRRAPATGRTGPGGPGVKRTCVPIPGCSSPRVTELGPATRAIRSKGAAEPAGDHVAPPDRHRAEAIRPERACSPWVQHQSRIGRRSADPKVGMGPGKLSVPRSGQWSTRAAQPRSRLALPDDRDGGRGGSWRHLVRHQGGPANGAGPGGIEQMDPKPHPASENNRLPAADQIGAPPRSGTLTAPIPSTSACTKGRRCGRPFGQRHLPASVASLSDDNAQYVPAGCHRWTAPCASPRPRTGKFIPRAADGSRRRTGLRVPKIKLPSVCRLFEHSRH